MAKAKAATASKKKPGRPPAVAAAPSPAKKKAVTPSKEVEKAATKVNNTSTLLTGLSLDLSVDGWWADRLIILSKLKSKSKN